MQPYDENFYAGQQSGSRLSAQEIVPLVMRLVGPQSVLDVGCGVGTWLSVFGEAGVGEVLGVDGDYVKREMLHVPPERFRAQDLKEPFRLGREFDLVVSLEVAEHLPPDCSASFVETLTAHGPAVLFSAAPPFQGGNGHVNEQWPDYWAGLFEARGYEVIDCVRKHVWRNEKVEWWYAQNVLLFARRDLLAASPALQAAHRETERSMLSVVHPGNFLHKRQLMDELRPENLTLGQMLGALPAVAGKAVRTRARRLLG